MRSRSYCPADIQISHGLLYSTTWRTSIKHCQVLKNITLWTSVDVDNKHTMLTRSSPIWKLRQILSLSSAATCLMGIHSWYARTAANFLSVKQAPEGEKEHPMEVSFESAVPAFHALSATCLKSESLIALMIRSDRPHGRPVKMIEAVSTWQTKEYWD